MFLSDKDLLNIKVWQVKKFPTQALQAMVNSISFGANKSNI